MTTLPTPLVAYKAATRTLEAIDAAILAKAENGFRPHLGASQIGKPCERALWLSFRWAKRATFPARILRVFARGHREEANLTALLEAAGIRVSTFDPATGKQYRLGGAHFSGSCDGMADGVPESPRVRHIVEYKTTNAKGFAKLQADGVRKAQPVHFDQMQVYMRWAVLDRALYVSVCKDDDQLHIERIDYDESHAARLVAKAERIVYAERMPEPISADPTWFECRFCDYHDLCHVTKLTREVNCRTCCHSTPVASGGWQCARWQSDIPTDAQRTGCDSHVIHTDLAPWPMKGGHGEWSAVYVVKGREVINGEDGYASSELIANANACAAGLKDEWVGEFPGSKIVG